MGYLGVCRECGHGWRSGHRKLALRFEYGYNAMFIASTLLGLIALLMTLRLPETLPNGRKVEWSDLNVFKGGVLDWSSWPAALALLPVAFAFGTFFNDFHQILWVHWVMCTRVHSTPSLLRRQFPCDLLRVGPPIGMVEYLFYSSVERCSLLECLGMLWGCLSVAETKWTAALAGIVYGMSVGINMPAIMAWTADLAKPGRGSACNGHNVDVA